MYTVIALFENESIACHTVTHFETREEAEAYKPLGALCELVTVQILQGHLSEDEAIAELFD